MPNWCVGTLRVRGTKENLTKFVLEGLQPVTYIGEDLEARMCNFYKSTYSLDDFRKNLETLHERLQKTFIYRLALKYGLIEEHKKKIEFFFEREEENE